MARPIVLSNGELFVGLDAHGQVYDFYFPYVGQENHVAARNLKHRIGIWTTDGFSWLDTGDWQIEQSYTPPGSGIGHTRATNEKLKMQLEFDDFVDSEQSAFIRNVHVINLADEARAIKMFMHQAFVISDSYPRDTVQYLPDQNAILHYKGRRAFVIGGEKCGTSGARESFDQFTVGLFNMEGRAGSYVDAEDGELSGNPVEHGQVDSVIGFNLSLAARGSERVFYWIACGKNLREATKVHERVRTDGTLNRLLKSSAKMSDWASKAEQFASAKIPASWRANFVQSALITKTHIDRRGAVIASCDSEVLNYGRDNYSYCWPRDAAHVLWPLLRLGYYDEVIQYMSFSRRVLNENGHFMHKYNADGSVGSSWHPYIHNGETGLPIQTDETALTLFLFCDLYDRYEDRGTLKDYFASLVRPMANFLAGYIDKNTGLPHASYDLWEERYLTSTYTSSVTFAALNAAATTWQTFAKNSSGGDLGDAEKDIKRWQKVADQIYENAGKLYDPINKYFYKGIRLLPDGRIEKTQDFDVSAFYGAYMFGLFPIDGDETRSAAETLIKHYDFSTNRPKLPRYDGDNYYKAASETPGNYWFVTSLWLAQYLISTGQPDRARPVIDWANNYMNRYLILPEQVNPLNDAPIGVAPLAWSHAEFLSTMIDFGDSSGEGML